MKFAVENFKIFKERQEFNIKPITVLVGPNGSGKSSILEAMQLFAGFNKEKSENPFDKLAQLNFSYLAQHGTFKNFLHNKETENGFLTIEFERQVSFKNQFLETQEGSKLTTSLKKIYHDHEPIKLILKFDTNENLHEMKIVCDNDEIILEMKRIKSIMVNGTTSFKITINFDFFYTKYLLVMKSKELANFIQFDKYQNFLKLEHQLQQDFEQFPLHDEITLLSYAERFSQKIADCQYLSENLYFSFLKFYPASFVSLTKEENQDTMNYSIEYADTINGDAAKEFFDLFIKNSLDNIIENALDPYPEINIVTTNRQHKPTSISYNEKENELQRQIYKFSKLDVNLKQICII